MPDFATPAGASFPAHTQRATAVPEPTDDALVLQVAVASFTGHATVPSVAIDTSTDTFHINPDPCWGDVGQCRVALEG